MCIHPKISAEEADAAGQMISQGEQKKKIEEQIAETEQNYLKAKAEAQRRLQADRARARRSAHPAFHR
jgi:hypothetical protein